MNRRRILWIVALLATLTFASPSEAESHVVYIPLARNARPDDSLIWAKVVKVSDGDTIKVALDGCPIEGMKVRLIGKDTPERGDCFWADAKERTERWCWDDAWHCSGRCRILVRTTACCGMRIWRMRPG